MTTQPEALRLAELWEKHSHGYALTPEAMTAAELRRLHAENEAYGVHLSERMKDLAKVEARLDALLELVAEMDRHEGAEGWSDELRTKINAAYKAVEDGK